MTITTVGEPATNIFRSDGSDTPSALSRSLSQQQPSPRGRSPVRLAVRRGFSRVCENENAHKIVAQSTFSCAITSARKVDSEGTHAFYTKRTSLVHRVGVTASVRVVNIENPAPHGTPHPKACWQNQYDRWLARNRPFFSTAIGKWLALTSHCSGQSRASVETQRPLLPLSLVVRPLKYRWRR